MSDPSQPQSGAAEAPAPEQQDAGQENGAGEQRAVAPRPRARRSAAASASQGPWKPLSIGLGALSLVLLGVIVFSPSPFNVRVPSPDHSSPESIAKSWAAAQQSVANSSYSYVPDMLEAQMVAEQKLAAFFAEDNDEELEDMEERLAFVRSNLRELRDVSEPQVTDKEDRDDGKVVVEVKWEVKRVEKDGDDFKVESSERTRRLTCVEIDGRWVIEGKPRGRGLMW